ncbi:MAG: hypothetical protein PHQ11_03000 [Paludibacter sp.]|nr:hypothetical protein [Paludibacter sp.]MDD4198660.1 hypothetical protein [Paludibacter sp.]MDD4427767.1 hypothetical protein [Paludibacter sp.]
MKIRILLAGLLFCTRALFLSAEDKAGVSFNGQMVLWTTAQLENPFVLQPGARLVPTLTGKYDLKKQSYVDFEASLNINGSLTFEKGNLVDTTGQIKPYRVWGRYANDQFEIRAGLQKINFGSAKLFRPLMWFDGMDVRDPLQLTDGVYAVLGRYYFENNANVWLWGMLGNKKPKGYELFGSSIWKPEFGGRIEHPAGPGEVGLSYHHRTLHSENNLYNLPFPSVELAENRIGLNGKWDVEIGVWFESSISLLQENTLTIPTKTDMLNVGADYTLPIGNGLGVTLEYFRYHTGNKLFSGGASAQLLGSMLTYPVSLLDNLSGMVFYLPAGDGADSMWLNYLTWSRSYDNVSLYLMAYWNPVHYNLPVLQTQGRNLFAGKGVQVMVSLYF